MATDNSRIAILGDATSDQLYPALFQCFAIIVCGYAAGRLNIVSKSESKGLATYVGTFALPSLIFLSLARVDFTTVNWTFLFAILLAKGVVFFAVIIVTVLVSRPINLGQAGIFAIFCTQSNDFALGYPIINAIYSKTHPEYALYLYLMAPISLAILNPFAFILMEINKQRESMQMSAEGRRDYNRMLLQIFRGIVFNPLLIMTVLGILGNIIFKHKLSIYIEGLLELFGQSFSASALFLLGLRMVGQIHRLRGPTLILPCVLIMVKLIVLPVVMRECVSGLNAGVNQTETSSLSTYAFLYGTIPTAPAVFVFSNLYQLEIDLMASSMVICTFLSAPITFLSAQVISINKDYADQIQRFGYNLSIVALVAAVWVTVIFIVTKKYKRLPHRITLCLNVTQVLMAGSVIWGGPQTNYPPSWHVTLQQACQIFSTFSCLLWTSMLSVGLLMLESRGPCFVLTLWPVLAFVAWGAPAVMVAALFATKSPSGPLYTDAVDAVRLSLLFFCLTVAAGCLILYVRFRRRSAQFAMLYTQAASESTPGETTSLVDNAEPTSHTQSISNYGCYGAITATPSPSKNANNCCSNDPNCDHGQVTSNSQDIEDLGTNVKECACPSSQKHRCPTTGPCTYLTELERAASQLGLMAPETVQGRGGQLFRHTVLIIVYSLAMFIGITYTTWKVLRKDEAGVFIEIQFLDTAAMNGQALVMFILFGLNPQEIIIPAFRYIKKKWHGTDTVVLPPVDELSFETKHVCDQFITHHLESCKKDIAKDIRYRMRTYHNAFRGACLVRWLVRRGLAADAPDAIVYARHLLDGRLIAHVQHAHHFFDSPLIYTFQ